MSTIATLMVKLGLDKKGFDEGVGGIGGAVKAAAKVAAAAAVTGLGISIKAFADFDAAMTQSLAIMGDVPQQMRSKMETAAREVGKTTSFSAAQAAESYFFLASAGLSAAASVEAMPRVAKFAQAGMFDMALATDLLTDAQSALGLTIRDDAIKNMENMIRVSDALVKANILSNATVQQFSEALTNKAANSMRDLSIEVEDGLAVLAAWADQGVKGAEAGERFNIVTRDMQTAARNNAAAFKEHNVAVFDQNGKFRNLADIVGDLENALAGMSDEQRGATLAALGFTDRSIAATRSLLGSSDAIRGYAAQLKDAGGITEEVANKQLETFWQKIGLLKSRFMDFAIEVGSKVVPKILEAIDKIEKWWSENGPVVIGVVNGIKEAMVIAFDVVASLIETAITIWENFRVPIEVIALIILQVMIPYWTLLGVKALISAGQQVLAWVMAKVAAVTSAAQTLVIMGLYVAGWVTMGAKALFHAAQVVAGWVMTAAAAVANAAVAVVQFGIMVAQWVFLGVQSLLHAAKVAAAWLIAMGPIGLVIAAVIALVALIVLNWDKIKQVIGAAWEWVKEKTSAVWGGIKGGVKSAVEWIVEKFNWLKEKIMAPIEAVGKLIKKLPFVPGSPIPMVTWANQAVKGINDAWSGLEAPRLADMLGMANASPIDLSTRMTIAGMDGRGAAQAPMSSTKSTTVNVYPRTDADPAEIAAEVGWAMKVGG